MLHTRTIHGQIKLGKHIPVLSKSGTAQKKTTRKPKRAMISACIIVQPVREDGLITSAEREVKDLRCSGLSCSKHG